MWEAYKNTIGSGDPATDAAEASATIFNRLGYNPFNVANDQIVGTDGKLNSSASVQAKGLDWYDILERKGSRQNHSISVSGGGEDHNLFFSTSYLNEKGYVIESDFERITTRLSGDFYATDWLSVGGNVSISLTNSSGPTGQGRSSIVNPFGFAKNMGSIYPIHLVDPVTGNYILDAGGERQFDLGGGYPEFGIQSRAQSPGRHAIAEAIFNEEVNRDNSVGFRYYAEAELIEGLKLKVTYGTDIQDDVNKSYENNIVGDGAPTGRYGERRSRRVIKNFNQVLTYSRSFNDFHNFDVTLGHESYDREYSQNSGLATPQTAAGIFEFDNFAVPARLGGYTNNKNIEGYFARVNYNMDSKYYMSASVRHDGSSVFHADSRWGTFYSVGGAWRIDQEEFMDNVSFVDHLKLRASWGQVGNDNVGGNNFYASQPLYDITSNAGQPAIFRSAIGNEDLQWETAESFDVALEFGILDNLIDGTLEYYKKTNSDLLFDVPIALSNGLNELTQNAATIQNSGIELSLTGHVMDKNDFKWDVTVSASTQKNEITSIPDPFVNGSKRWEEGRSRYDFYIYHSAGVDPATGDALYYMFEDELDTDDVPTGKRTPVLEADGTQSTTNDWDAAGRAYAEENSLPDVMGSIQNRLSYKGFALDFMFTFASGGKILDNGYSAMMHSGTYGRSIHIDALNAWKAPGDITSVPRLENANTDQVQRQSTRFLTDASYLTLRSVNLSYTFDDTITDKLGVNNLRLFLSGENLFINSKRQGLNPQYSLAGTTSGNDYNPNKVISFGVNVSL
jgi:TonB-linked SusC/RagA family outer membrane protein